jgi:hypothetical protein
MQGLLHTHSLLRYFILIALVVVLVLSFTGMMNKRPFGKWDNKFSLYLLIFTHMQVLVGLILYFVSPRVQFDASTMKTPILRYWAVEHVVGMLIAVVLITVARATSKRLTSDTAKHKRLFILNLIALLVVIATLAASDRGILTMGPR